MLTARITNLTRLNPTRVDLYDRFQRLLEQYKAGSLNVQQYFDELVKLSHSLSEEEARAVSAGLSEEQLAVFDLLTRPGARPHRR
jgi:type I restriction enzyme, R subunit